VAYFKRSFGVRRRLS